MMGSKTAPLYSLAPIGTYAKDGVEDYVPVFKSTPVCESAPGTYAKGGVEDCIPVFTNTPGTYAKGEVQDYIIVFSSTPVFRSTSVFTLGLLPVFRAHQYLQAHQYLF